MKHTKILALLGLATLELHAGVKLLGKDKPHARLTEEQLDILENALAEKDQTETIENLQKELNEAKALASTYEKMVADTAAVLEKGMETAGLENQKEIAANINLLAEKCKEYGEAQNRHTFPENNGKDEPTNGFINGYIDPNDEHNKMLSGLNR